jgi:hypothetical protein
MKARALVILVTTVLLATAVTPAQKTLADRYRTGRILLRADEDWTSNLPEGLFFEGGNIAVAPDGSVFVSNGKRHTIFKFDASGKFVKDIGRHGQGPGDLTNPGHLSILDGKYLVVGEYATSGRISIFNLDGEFVKIVTTGRFASRPVALKNGKIAYVCIKGRMEPTEMINVEEVMIIDWMSGVQKSVVKHEIRNPMKQAGPGKLVMAEPGAVLLTRTLGGGVIVGTTRSARLDVFSAEGLKLRTLDTGWKAIPVTSKYRAEYRAFLNSRAIAEGRKPSTADPLLPDVLDILQNVWTDADGNILACKKTECLENCPLVIRAYSPEGDFLCDFEIEPGPFVLQANLRLKRIELTGHGVYGLLTFKDDPEGYLHLTRTVFKPQ